jgi:Protein of unknown function (DUF2510)
VAGLGCRHRRRSGGWLVAGWALGGPWFAISALLGVYAAGAWRAQQLVHRGRLALSSPAPPWGISLRIALLPVSASLEPVWMRPKRVLTIANGMVHLWPTGLAVPVTSVRVAPGPRWGRGGVYLDSIDGRRFRVSLVSAFDIGLSFAPLLVDPKLTGALRRLVQDEAARAVARQPQAGWYPDSWTPQGWRWWDGRGWTDHVR